jgi:hypothetical protein
MAERHESTKLAGAVLWAWMSLLDSRNASSVRRLRLASSVMTLVIVWGTFQVFRIKRPRPAHPRNQITMVLPLVVRDWVDEHTADYQSIQPMLNMTGTGVRRRTHERGPRWTTSQQKNAPVSWGVKVPTSNIAVGWGPIGASQSL